MKKVVAVHGWYGHPTDGWWPWLIQNLHAQGFQMISPQMPSPEWPQLIEWVDTLNGLISNPDNETYFVGHSLGCITILNYLQQLPNNVHVGGVVLVAGFTQDLHFNGYDNELANYFDEPLNWEAIKSHCSNFWIISSDNDPKVSGKNHTRLVTATNARETLEHNKLHMTGDDGVFELPSVLEALLELSASKPSR